jgi:ribosomal protein S12 methylthiotransferase accessory factor
VTAAQLGTVTAVGSAAGDLSLGPSADEIRRSWLSTFLARLGGTASISVNDGWSLAWERAQWRRRRSALLSIRLFSDEVQLGPLWSVGTTSGCAGCAEWRSRLVSGHPLHDQLDEPRSGPRYASPSQPEWLAVAVDAVAAQPLAPGELVIVGASGTGRHQIPRAANCPICAGPPPDPRLAPPAIAFEQVAALPDDPLRAAPSVLPLDRTTMRGRLIDARFGPLVQVMRDTAAPFAMSDAVLPGAPAMGYGRAPTFGAAEPVAILEAYERLGGVPGPAAILKDVPYQEITGRALDPATLGGYTAQQFAHPLCRVLPSDATTPMDWAWGHVLDSGEPLLVPAEIAFYGHRHETAAGAARKRRYFDECSSGCALGGSLTEATLHALLELHERDAFLLAWHSEAPLPRIDPASLRDSPSRELLALIDSRGFETHLLVTTADIDLPAVWTLAIRRDGSYPASYSSAGAGADPARAIRGALWELAQQVCEPTRWTRDHVEPMAENQWLVVTIDDHIGLYTLPTMLPRLGAALGGPMVPLDEAFPGWPQCLADAAGGDVRGALDQVAERFRRAGLDQIIVVDQSSRDHLDLGLRVVKAVVPGIVPMCFGHAQQRLLGLDRLTRVLPAHRDGDIPYDPHPFP